jgi:hypothetical protein
MDLVDKWIGSSDVLENVDTKNHIESSVLKWERTGSHYYSLIE